MHKKSMLFGVGVGILSMVAISFVTYVVQRAAHFDENSRLMAMVEQHEAAPVANSVDADYIVDRARDIGMIFPDEAEPEVVLYTPDPDLDFYDDENNEAEPVLDSDEGHIEDGDYNEDELEQPQTETESEPIEEPEPRSSWVFTITGGVTASQVALEFESRGLVDSADEFLQFLVNNGHTQSILAGQHEVPFGADFYEIVDIIIYGN